jgi:transposase
MARRRQIRYSPEFKAEAIRMVRMREDGLAKIARELGVAEPTLRAWVEATRPPATPPVTTDERTELQQLRRENARLREERDILKKATAFFAKYSE